MCACVAVRNKYILISSNKEIHNYTFNFIYTKNNKKHQWFSVSNEISNSYFFEEIISLPLPTTNTSCLQTCRQKKKQYSLFQFTASMQTCTFILICSALISFIKKVSDVILCSCLSVVSATLTHILLKLFWLPDSEQWTFMSQLHNFYT